MGRVLTIIGLVMMLAGCAGSQNSPALSSEPVVLTQAIMAECRLLTRAYQETKKRTGQHRPGIVEGCPDYKKIAASSNRVTQAGSFLSAATARVPANVKAGGATAQRLYQRMIARGTPAKIAQIVSQSPEFKVAVNVANQ